jgi:hypothetical protein
MEEGEVYGFSDKEMLELINDANFALQAKQKFSWGIKRPYVLQKKN